MGFLSPLLSLIIICSLFKFEEPCVTFELMGSLDPSGLEGAATMAVGPCLML
ncbi:pollen-specific leucine-rich repeat extensin-like protein 3 [Iris pallida]|uniref:Pollen-specific leucine-rich repeat extensin-like protein 3 n=1 Tax=Iris pallida TaxID=29817 RepID=A0AAX6HTC7_IRIPA|nr:pollen-specific leucine-rich repeat extensin-like protein 3 [Iris pallida]